MTGGMRPAPTGAWSFPPYVHDSPSLRLAGTTHSSQSPAFG